MPMPPDAWASDPSAQNEQPPDQYVKVGFVDSEPLPAKFLNWALGWLDSMFRVEHNPNTGAHTDVHADSLEVGGGYGGGSGATISGGGAGSFSSNIVSGGYGTFGGDLTSGGDVKSGTAYGIHAGAKGFQYKLKADTTHYPRLHLLAASPFLGPGSSDFGHKSQFNAVPGEVTFKTESSGGGYRAQTVSFAWTSPAYSGKTDTTVSAFKLINVTSTMDNVTIKARVLTYNGGVVGTYTATLSSPITGSDVTLTGSAIDMTDFCAIHLELFMESNTIGSVFEAASLGFTATKASVEPMFSVTF